MNQPQGPWQQQPYQQYPPQQPYGWYSQPAPQPRNGMGTAGFVCGLLALPLGFLPGWLSLVSLPLAVLGVVLGSVGYGYAKRGMATNRGLAQAGVVLGVIALVLILVGLLVLGLAAS